MQTTRYRRDDELVAILEKVVENSYQRKILKEVAERVSSKMARILDARFPGDELKRLREEFFLLKHSMGLLC